MLPEARGHLQAQADAAGFPAAAAAEPALSRSTWGRGEVGGKDEVLRAFGLTAEDRQEVLELGRQAIQRASGASDDPDFEEGSDFGG